MIGKKIIPGCNWADRALDAQHVQKPVSLHSGAALGLAERPLATGSLET